MRRSTSVITAIALGFAAQGFAARGVLAQAPANFAGKWTMVVDPNAPPPPGRGAPSQVLTIDQDDKTITVTRTTQMGEVKMVTNLDGSDSKNTMTMGGNSVDQISKAKWDGKSLTISTSTNFGGNTFQSSQTFSMDASGNLVVQATSPGRGGGAPTTSTYTYKKG